MSDDIAKAFEELVHITGGEVVVAFVKTGNIVKVLCDRAKMDESAEVIATLVRETLEKQKIREAMKWN